MLFKKRGGPIQVAHIPEHKGYLMKTVTIPVQPESTDRLKKFNHPLVVPLLLMSPALLLMAVFAVYPVFNAFRMSFYDSQLLSKVETFIGFQNYARLFSDPEFINSLKVSVLYIGGSVILQFGVGVLLAALLSSKGLKGKTFFRTAFILPYTLSELVVSLIWLQMLDSEYGVINHFVTLFGADPQSWLFDWALPMVVVANVWWGTTFSLLMLEAAMQGIPKDLYEAAEVDGASAYAKFVKITLPSIRYVSLLNLIMITLYTMNSFGIIFVLTAGGPVGSTDVIGMYMWRNAFQFMDLGVGATISTFIFMVNIVITIIYIKLFGMETMKNGS